MRNEEQYGIRGGQGRAAGSVEADAVGFAVVAALALAALAFCAVAGGGAS